MITIELNWFQEGMEFMVFFLLRCVLPVSLISIVIYRFVLYPPLLKPLYMKWKSKEGDVKILRKWYKRKRIGKKRRERFAVLCICLSYGFLCLVVSYFFGAMQDSFLYVTGRSYTDEVTVTNVWSNKSGSRYSVPYVQTKEFEETFFYEGVFLQIEKGKTYHIKYLPHSDVILNVEEISSNLPSLYNETL